MPLQFLPLDWYHPHIWGCRRFSHVSWFQLVTHPAWHFSWCAQCIGWTNRVTADSPVVFLFQSWTNQLFHTGSSLLFLDTHTVFSGDRQDNLVFSSIQSLSRVQLLSPHGRQLARPPCVSPTPGDYSNSSPLSQWCHPTNCPLLSPSPLTFNLSQHHRLFK